MTLPSDKKIKDIAKAIDVNILNAIALNSLINQLNDSDELFSVGNNKYGTHGLNLMLNSLIESLMLALSRLLDTASDVASVPSLIEKLQKHPKLVDRYVAEASTWGFDQSEAIRDKIQKIISAYSDLMASEEFEKMKLSLKNFRDESLAHSLVREKREQPKFHYLNDVLERLVPICEDLYLCVTGVGQSYSNIAEIRDKYSEHFEGVLISGFEQQG